jgi:hypothetical protein
VNIGKYIIYKYYKLQINMSEITEEKYNEMKQKAVDFF